MRYQIYTDTPCKVITAVFSIVILALAAATLMDASAPPAVFAVIVALLLIYAATFLIRPTAYTIDDNRLIMQSILFRKAYAIDEVASIQLLAKQDFRNAYRSYGIGGLFSYRGSINTQTLGSMLSFARGFKNNLVVIGLKSGQHILLSPADETSFYQAVKEKAGI